MPDFPEQASSARTADYRSVIVFGPPTLKSDPAYSHFLMAHECCHHHTLGHTRLAQQRFGGLGVHPFAYLRPPLKNMGLDADGCAVHMLTLTRDPEAIMLEFGDRQTGAYYPTGIEPADNIANAAEEETR